MDVVLRVRTVPRVPGQLIPRDEARAILDRRSALTVVRGPVGWGKTTVVAEWVMANTDIPRVFWFNRENDVRDREAFWRGLLKELAPIAPEVVLDSVDSADGLRAALVRAFRTITTPLLIVIDNFGLPGDYWTAVSDDISALIQRAPLVSIIVIGRASGALESAAASSSLPVSYVRPENLAVHEEEVRLLAPLLGIPAPSAVLVESILEAGDGGITYARQFLENARREGPDVVNWDSERLRALWLRHGLDDFTQMTPDAGRRKMIGLLAVSTTITDDLAVALTGDPQAPAFLRSLIDVGLVEPVGPTSDQRVRLIEPLQRVAAAYLQRTHPAAALTAQGVVAQWNLRQGELMSALDAAARSGDLGLVSEVLLAALPRFTDADLAHSYETLRTLPLARIRRYPIVSLVFGIALFSDAGRQELAWPYLEAAHDLARLRRPHAPRTEQLWLAAVESATSRLLGDSADSLAAAKIVLDIAEKLPEDDRTALGGIYGMALNHAGVGAFYAETYPIARDAYRRAVAWSEHIDDIQSANIQWGNLALLEALAGDFGSAAAALGHLDVGVWVETETSLFSKAFTTFARAWLHINEGRPDVALVSLSHVPPPNEIVEHWGHLATIRAIALVMAGRTAEGVADLRLTLQRRLSDRTAPGELHRHTMVERILQLTTGDAIYRGPGAPIHARLESLDASTSALRLALAGQSEPATEALAKAEAAARSPLHDGFVAIAGLVLAARTADAAKIALFAGRLHLLTTQVNLRWPTMFIPAEDRGTLLRTLDDSAVRDTLIDVFSSIPPMVADGTKAAPAILTAREREVLTALAEGASRNEIAERLFVSVNTVKTQLRSLYRKLDVSDREAALAKSIALGLLENDVV